MYKKENYIKKGTVCYFPEGKKYVVVIKTCCVDLEKYRKSFSVVDFVNHDAENLIPLNSLNNMMEIARLTHDTFKHQDLFYNDTFGFHDSDKEPWPCNSFKTFNDFLKNAQDWELVKIVKMTKSQIEKELGYKIEIIEG